MNNDPSRFDTIENLGGRVVSAAADLRSTLQWHSDNKEMVAAALRKFESAEYDLRQHALDALGYLADV